VTGRHEKEVEQMVIKRGLGRGLGALIKDGTASQLRPDTRERIIEVPVERVRKSSWQPRHTFEQEALAGLTQSIRERGILQPLLVRSLDDGYELIAGERRLIAAADAGLETVPVIVMDAADSEALELTLIENVQREDLNVLEEAGAYQMLADKFDMTQEQISDRVGKARASITNAMRLLGLPEKIKQLIREGTLTAGHAKLLTGIEIEQEQLLYAGRAVKENLSVRNLEKLIQKARRVPRKPRASRDDVPASHISYLSDKLHSHFGTSVRITTCRTLANGKKAKGSIEIDVYSSDDLDRILHIMGVSAE